MKILFRFLIIMFLAGLTSGASTQQFKSITFSVDLNSNNSGKVYIFLARIGIECENSESLKIDITFKRNYFHILKGFKLFSVDTKFLGFKKKKVFYLIPFENVLSIKVGDV